MDRESRRTALVGRFAPAQTAIAMLAVLGLLQLAAISDLLSNITRPLVVLLARMAGVVVVDTGTSLLLAPVEIPWMADCAGLNVLGILLAVTLWTNRHQPFTRSAWLRLALVAPVALLANVGRIVTLIAYRWVSYPSVESVQLHYFFGFLWMVPFLGLFTPRPRGSVWTARVETVYFAAVLALVAPYAIAAGGTLVAASALVALVQNRLTPIRTVAGGVAAAGWLAAGLFVAAARMESLWIPWLLTCPWFASPQLWRSPGRVVGLLSTLPLVAIHPVGRIAGMLAVAWQITRMLRNSPVEGLTSAPTATGGHAGLTRLEFAGLVGLVIFPFLASSAAAQTRVRQQPPPGLMSVAVDPTTYRVRTVAQSPDVAMDWFEPYGDGRHHTLPVCMRYRGVALHESEQPGVFTDGAVWMREFFLVDGHLVLSYPEYLRRTLSPFSSPGIHLIASAHAGRMTALAFAEQAEQLARDIHGITNGRSPAAADQPPPTKG